MESMRSSVKLSLALVAAAAIVSAADDTLGTWKYNTATTAKGTGADGKPMASTAVFDKQ
jgi:hypothetical protein